MAIIRWTPSSDLPMNLWDMHRQLDRMFDRVFPGSMTNQDLLSGGFPQFHINEEDTEYTITAEIPGVRQSDLKITVDDNILTVRGQLRREEERREQGRFEVERTSGYFTRSIVLPRNINENEAEAFYESGILTIRVPKSVGNRAREIDVQSRSGIEEGRSIDVESTRSARQGNVESRNQGGRQGRTQTRQSTTSTTGRSRSQNRSRSRS